MNHLATVTIFCRTPYIEVTPAPAAEGEEVAAVQITVRGW